LGSTWVLLGYLVVGTGNRGETAGFGTGIAPWAYALTQFRVIVHYLGLSIWPHPLVLDYGIDLAKHAAEVVPYALIVALLMVATVISLWRWPAIGFAGVWFFAILAPTSSVLTVATETMAEHRMYLPLAAVVVLGVMGIHALVGQRSVSVCLVLAVGLGFLTVQRNEAPEQSAGAPQLGERSVRFRQGVGCNRAVRAGAAHQARLSRGTD
jgi:hypothetical protein